MSRSIFRRGAVLAGVAALALAASACAGDTGGGGGTSDGDSGELTSVTIGAVFTTATVPIWIAESEGIFEKHGLDVTIQQSPNFAASAPSVINGQMEFANAATTPFITAISQGMPLQMVAGVSVLAPIERDGNMVVVPADSDIKSPKDLEGRTVATLAVGAGPSVGVAANYNADGGTPDGINWVTMNLNEQLPALQNGQVDAAVMSPPFSGEALDQGFISAFNAYIVPGLDVIPTGFTDAVLLSSTTFLEENPETAKAMYDAMVEANDFAQNNEDVVRATLQEKVELAEETAAVVAIPDFAGPIDPADIQRVIDAMFTADLIAEELDANDMIWMP